MSKTLQNLVLAENEKVIRSYEASELVVPKTKGYLIVTTRRLMFIGESEGLIGQSTMHREIDITKVNGVSALYKTGRSFGKLIVAIILAVLFIVIGFIFPPFFLFLALPAFLFYRFFNYSNAEMVLRITAEGAESSPISFGSVENGGIVNAFLRWFGIGGDSAIYASIAGPGRDAYTLVREIGAVVLDVQTLGDRVAEKWSEKIAEPVTENTHPAASIDPTFFSQQ